MPTDGRNRRICRRPWRDRAPAHFRYLRQQYDAEPAGSGNAGIPALAARSHLSAFRRSIPHHKSCLRPVRGPIAAMARPTSGRNGVFSINSHSRRRIITRRTEGRQSFSASAKKYRDSHAARQSPFQVCVWRRQRRAISDDLETIIGRPGLPQSADDGSRPLLFRGRSMLAMVPPKQRLQRVPCR